VPTLGLKYDKIWTWWALYILSKNMPKRKEDMMV
jgi:hypothetical protein